MSLPTINNIILPNYLKMVKEIGSRNPKTRAREGGVSVFISSFSSFCISAPPPSEKIAGGFQQAGKKEGGPGEGIFARLLTAPKARQCVAKRFRRLALSQTSKQNNFQFLLRKIWRAGVKKLKENCFALLAEVRRAETRSGANQAFFVQKRFELRSVIATSSDILKIQERFVARSPRLRRVSLRKKPCISELNRKVGQIQIQFFGKANGGSACEARNKQSLFPIFSIPPKAEHKASFSCLTAGR